MIKKLIIVASLVGVGLSAGLIEDGIAQAVKGNNIEALKLFEKSCNDAGMGKGCFYSGQAYARGTIVKEDMPKALDFFKKACNLGYTDGCMTVGSAYFYGKGVKKDFTKAREMFTKSCEQDDPNGCFLLGSIYDLGKGVQRDQSEAKKRYDEACKYGSKMGCKYSKELTQSAIK